MTSTGFFCGFARSTFSFCFNVSHNIECFISVSRMFHGIFRTFSRQQDRFYDGDAFMMDNPDADDGLDNNSHPLRSRDNLYDRYSDAPVKIVKSSNLSDATSSLKSPSSLTTTTKLGSQSSLRSAISMKEGGGGNSRGGGGGGKSPVSSRAGGGAGSSVGHYERNGKYSQQELDRSSNKISNKNLAYSGNKSRSKEYLGSTTTVSPSPDGSSVVGGGGGRDSRQASSVRSTTPVPAQRKTLKNASKTHLVEGIPQTEV